MPCSLSAKRRKAMFARLAVEEKSSSKNYHKIGLHSIARDESRHSKLLRNKVRRL